MTDARAALHALRDHHARDVDLESTFTLAEQAQARVARHRVARTVVTSLAGAAAAVALVLAVVHVGWRDDAAPIQSPSPSQTPSPSPSETATVDLMSLPCTPATVVPGNPIELAGGGSVGGYEGWFNVQSPAEVCASRDGWGEWETLAAAHPDTVWINTSDNTMVEAYYRTTRDALGQYGALSGEAEVPSPDPSWPADSVILIDAGTGEILEVEDLPTDSAP